MIIYNYKLKNKYNSRQVIKYYTVENVYIYFSLAQCKKKCGFIYPN